MPPPPHVAGAVHVPQLMFPPQPSGAEPQLMLAGHAVAGRQRKQSQPNAFAHCTMLFAIPAPYDAVVNAFWMPGAPTELKSQA